MKTFRHALLLVAASAALACAFASPSLAANRASQNYPGGSVDAAAGSTFATTSFADLPGATVTLTPQVDPNRVEAPGTPVVADTIIVEFNADVIKATATTGTCELFVNGALLAKTARSIDFAAKQGTMTLIAAVPNTTTGAQTVKMQCKSGDTNVFTVNNAMLRVIESF